MLNADGMTGWGGVGGCGSKQISAYSPFVLGILAFLGGVSKRDEGGFRSASFFGIGWTGV